MRAWAMVALCIAASAAIAEEREIPYEELHDAFSRVANVPAGKYFHVVTRFESQDPAVATPDIKLVIRSRGGDIPVPVAADGVVQFPVREDLEEEDPPVVTNVEARANAEGARIPELLRAQVTEPVRFTEMIREMARLGVTRVLDATSPLQVGDVIRIEGRCTAVEGSAVKLELSARNQRGEDVLKGAVAEGRVAER